LPSANETSAASLTVGRESGPSEEPTVLVRKLGSSSASTYLERILTEDGEHRFVVVERASRGSLTADEISENVREARVVAALDHPNVVHVRAVTLRADEIQLTSDYVAGERLSDLWRPASGSAPAISLPVALRILVDVATGLGALHKLRSAEGQERVKFVHAEVTSENVLVGLDGVAVLLRAARVRRKGVPNIGIGTLAPEILAGEASDQRADIYSLGALLWQALSGRPLFPHDDVDAILARAKRDTVARPVATKQAPWALPLVEVAERALASAPDKRFPTASSMLTELRKIAGPKLATAEEVAKFVESAAGAKIAARLADVQASAVIRKATSIPAPRSSPARELAVVAVGAVRERDGGETARAADVVTVPVVTSSGEAEVPVATAAAPIVPAVDPPRELAPPVAPSGPAAADPLPPAKPVKTAPDASTPTPSRARTIARVHQAPKVAPAIMGTAPPGTTLAQRARWAMGVWLAIALLTGWFAWRAIRNRQVIETAAVSSPVETTMVPEPAAGPVGEVRTKGAEKSSVVTAPTPTQRTAAAPTSKARPAKSTESPTAPSPKIRRK
jgi:hypothetical protein